MKYGLLFLMFLIGVGCAASREIPKEQSPLKSYLETKGYQVISYGGRAESYELTKQKLVTLPYMMYWGLQPVDPSVYLGKTINVERFMVKNHPLSKGKVDVYVYEVNGQPIGGTSYPHGHRAVGGYWSLEGKTLEELQPKSFPEWQEAWMNQYRVANE